jgi:hypothetical protein
LGRKLRALDTAGLAPAERQRLERLLRRTQARIMRTLVGLTATAHPPLEKGD